MTTGGKYKYAWQVLIVLVACEMLLVAFSVINNNLNIKFSLPWAHNYKVKFVSPNEILTGKSDRKQDDSDTTRPLLFAYQQNYESASKLKDTLLNLSDTGYNDLKLLNPANDGKYALDLFFDAVSSGMADTGLVRIGHYGDSQLEGDRVDQILRVLFQQQFGGIGIGFVPFLDVASHGSLNRTMSDNWRRYSVFHDRYPNGYYGYSGNVYAFTYDDNIVKKADTTAEKEHGPEVAPAGKKIKATYDLTLYNFVYYHHIDLLWGQAPSPCVMEVYDGKKLLYTDTLPVSNNFEMTRLRVGNAHDLHFKFTADASPRFYGFLVDGRNGVQVDNLAIRGHSGDGLNLINRDYLSLQVSKLNQRLFIFEYGANIVPYKVANYQFFEDDVYYMIMRYKEAAPLASMIVIGVGDMATKVDGEYESYGNIVDIRNAQRKAAKRAGVAFWDLYESMGGKNSIIDWANETPKLAGADYCHLTYEGQKRIANDLYNAIMIEYEEYIGRHEHASKTP